MVMFAATNYGLIYAVLLGLLTVATIQTTKDLKDHINPGGFVYGRENPKFHMFASVGTGETERDLRSARRRHLRNRQPKPARERRSLFERIVDASLLVLGHPSGRSATSSRFRPCRAHGPINPSSPP